MSPARKALGMLLARCIDDARDGHQEAADNALILGMAYIMEDDATVEHIVADVRKIIPELFPN